MKTRNITQKGGKKKGKNQAKRATRLNNWKSDHSPSRSPEENQIKVEANEKKRKKTWVFGRGFMCN